MKLKTKLINKIEKYNPIAIHRRKAMRSRLTNRDMTLLIPNCAGGHLFHDLGLRFMSPTINIMMYQNEFLKFVFHLDDYIESELHFYKHQEFDFPCAKLSVEGLPDVNLHFTHYESEEEAREKWESRKKRINKDNMFIFIEERDEITKEDIESLAQLNVKGIVAFTCNDYPDIPYQVYIQKYHNDGEIGNILKRRYWDDSKEYENYFDFVKWFNEADGAPYDVSLFRK